MTELLAPAGNIECAYAAIDSGADAIYLGLKSFSARASAGNFGYEELAALCARAHALGVRVHVALNTLVKESERENFINSAIAAHNAGADALIIQDIFLGAYLKKTYPRLCLHLSTQAGTNNIYGARLAKRFGFARVILARETPLDEIKKIAAIIETEVFVQGALCTCFSGQCYFSSFAGGNSGNRGRCKQPCRKLYSIDREGFEEKAYALSLSDLSVGEDIIKLAEAGVYSFKIEGRMRRPEYVAAAVKYYRGILDGIPEKGDLSALKRTYNRGNYTKGLAFGQDKTFISRSVQGHIGEYCGTVKVVGGKYLCLSEVICRTGDSFKVLRSGKEVGGADFVSPAKGGFIISSGKRLLNGDKVFITTDSSLTSKLLGHKKLRGVNLSVFVAESEPMRAIIDGKEYCSQFIPSVASSRPVSRGDIVKCFDKVDTYPFKITYGEVEICGSPFVPASALNAFRREVYANYYSGISRAPHDKIENMLALPEIENSVAINRRSAVIARDFKGVDCDIAIFKPNDYSDPDFSGVYGFKGEKFLFIPPYFNGELLEAIKPRLELFDGVYCDGYWAVEFCRENNKKLFAGTGFNIANSISLSYLDAEYIALSKELTFSELQPLCLGNTFCLSSGNLKLMDLLYCPFGRTCKTCDRRNVYTLTDENGRAFPMRRYKLDSCAFEVYNCVPLVAVQSFTGNLSDCTLGNAAEISALSNDADALRKYFENYTSGHSKNPVF